MLGRHHTSISIFFVALFLVPLFFIYSTTQNSIYLYFMLSFSFAVMIGSLAPDADCGGNATLHYKYRLVDDALKKVIYKPVVWIFQFISKKDLAKLEYDVKEEHRGIMHSPIGILLTSTMLIIPVTIGLLFIQKFNFIIFLGAYMGLILGQFLHIMEDTLTVSGINWKFPFGTKKIKGKIYTFPKFEDKQDIRPNIYIGIFAIPTVVLFLAYQLGHIIYSIWIVYLTIIAYSVFAWLILYLSSQSESKRWYWKKETLKQFKKIKRQIEKNFDDKPKRRKKQKYSKYKYSANFKKSKKRQ